MYSQEEQCHTELEDVGSTKDATFKTMEKKGKFAWPCGNCIINSLISNK